MMMDYDLGDDAGQLRQHLRELISNNVPADFLGACTCLLYTSRCV